MSRFILLLAACLCIKATSVHAGESSPFDVDFAVPLQGKSFRVAVSIEVEGRPLSALWHDNFKRLFAFHDRDGNGFLSTEEAALLPPPLALRQALGNGFTPPIGKAPPFTDLDPNGDGKVTLEELTTFYRRAGIGQVLVGVGRLPMSRETTDALLKRLDTSGDGKVDEAEWKAADAALRSLDRNDDELIGAGELVPQLVYPGTAGTTQLTPRQPGRSQPPLVKTLPLVVLADDAVARSKEAPDARWKIQFSESAGEPFVRSVEAIRLDGWVVEGKLVEATEIARRRLIDLFENPREPGEGGRRRGGSDSLEWLIPMADRNGDGKLDRVELDGWLDLQSKITQGLVLLTVLDAEAGLFEILDVNHDGALSPRELRGAWDRVRAAGCVTGGALDRSKLPRVLLISASRGYPAAKLSPSQVGPNWFRAMDRNGDGDISRREFTGPADVFDRLDSDRDGLLSPTEAEKTGSK